jgi:type II secretory pathway pseudopilin PulG
MRLRHFESETVAVGSSAAGRKPSAPAAGFTLIEVVLAISIAAGILVVVLLFYHQTESLRSRLLEETSRLATMRLVMERLSAELSTARLCEPHGQGLSGGADNIQFVKLGFPNPWDRTNASSSFSSGSPLRVVSYSLLQDTNNQTESGLLRSEEALAKSFSISTNLLATNDPSAALPVGTAVPRKGSVASQIQFLRFRYWDGSTWSEAWSAPVLPMGVEVSLGRDPLPPELTADEYPFELFRRVIYLPNHAASRAPSLAVPAVTQVTR